MDIGAYILLVSNQQEELGRDLDKFILINMDSHLIVNPESLVSISRHWFITFAVHAKVMFSLSYTVSVVTIDPSHNPMHQTQMRYRIQVF